MGKKILVIGGAGFIGRHLVQKISVLGNEVVVLDMAENPFENKNIKFYKLDINDKEKFKEIFEKEKPSIVYHLAGAISLRTINHKDAPLYESMDKIVGWTKIILEECKSASIEKLIFFSSAAIYGDLKDMPIPTPESYFSPTSLYGMANAKIEEKIKNSGVLFVILRLANVYGPYQWETGIIPHTIINFLNGNKPVISGDGSQTRDFIYVDDVVKVAILAMDKTGIYNIGSGEEHSIKEITELIKKELKSDVEIYS